MVLVLVETTAKCISSATAVCKRADNVAQCADAGTNPNAKPSTLNGVRCFG
jgi:hypothetical protein